VNNEVGSPNVRCEATPRESLVSRCDRQTADAASLDKPFQAATSSYGFVLAPAFQVKRFCDFLSLRAIAYLSETAKAGKMIKLRTTQAGFQHEQDHACRPDSDHGAWADGIPC